MWRKPETELAGVAVLKSLDVLIGLVVIILALSMTVTVVTQALTTILNSRGRHLRRGLTDLLQQLDPGLTAAISKQIAGRVLTHPLVSGSQGPWAAVSRWIGGPRYGNVIHREEFTKLLMVLATDGDTAPLAATAKGALTTALAQNGVDDPDAAMNAVRRFALELERSQPALANAARQNLALLHAGPGDLVAKVNSWFDQSMDRVSQRFTASTRAITFAGAFIVAFGLQVDTPSLMNRLAMDDQMRAAFVAEGTRMAPQAPQPGKEQEYRAFLAQYGVIKLPSSDDYVEGFYSLPAVFGMLLTALLLSLGAPFWYNTLARLLQLRSVLAFKDDKQRSERQAVDTASGAAPADTGTAPPALTGERGDLAAVG
jgi:hypothetical protein